LANPSENLLVDTDVHEYLRSGEDLLPYLSAHWQRYLTQYGWNHATFPTALPYVPPSDSGVMGRGNWVLPDGTMGTDLDALRRHLFDEECVSHAILDGFFHVSAQRGQYEFTAALAAAYNDWQIEHWLDKEPRLFGSVHVVADDPAAAAREIDRVAAHPQIVQVFLPTVADRQYGDPAYRPIFEAAVRNDLVVALHHGPHTPTLFGYPRYYIEFHTLAAPQAGIGQLTSIVCNGLFDRYEDLKVVLLETGVAWVPWFMWRLDQQYRELRIEVPWVKRMPSTHLRERVRIATQPMSDVKAVDFVRLVEMTESEEMFVFSSDYPHYDADSIERVMSPAIPEGLRRRVRYQNALETFPRLAQRLAA
jgi:predicted TIM-barrel fold metal-dependent hydrolase